MSEKEDKVLIIMSTEIYKEWLQQTRAGPFNGLRRPRWLGRPFMPDASMFNVEK